MQDINWLAPQAFADGHTSHFALELTNSMKLAYQAKQKQEYA
ncbi:hypothetical protein [Ligilactobacillus salitolerans]|nr:hypothetical protein [Ligilactobacillus salitolerans]